MKFLILFFLSLPLFFLFPKAVFALEGDLVWDKSRDFYAGLSEMAHGVALDSSAMYVVGEEGSPGNRQWRFEKRNLAGDVLWSNALNPSALYHDSAKAVAVDSTGVYMAGQDRTDGSSGTKWRIEKRSLSDGNTVLWSQVATSTASSSSISPYGMAVDATGVYIVGQTMLPGYNYQWLVRKLDLSTGNLIWSRNNIAMGWAEDVAVDTTGVYVIGSEPSPTYGFNRLRVEKLNLSTGASIANQTIDTSSASDDQASGVAVDASGVYVVGYENTNYRWNARKYNLNLSSSIPLWAATSTANFKPSFGVAIDSGGLYIIGGQGTGASLYTDWYIEKRALASGVAMWTKTSSPTGGLSYGNYPNDAIVNSTGIYMVGAMDAEIKWRFEKRALANSCAITGSGPRLSTGMEIYRVQAVGGNQIYMYSDAPGSPAIYSFSGCGTISGDVNQPPGTALYGIGSGNTISIRNAVATSTVYGTITFSPGINITGDFSGLGNANNPMLSATEGPRLYTSGTNPLTMIFDTIPFTTCTGPVSISWTDPTITANTTKIRKVHIDELRTWIDDRRVDAGLSAYSWTDPTLTVNTTKIRKVHFDDLRTAISQVYTTCGQAAPTWTDPTLTANTTKIRAVHMTELRSAVSSAP